MLKEVVSGVYGFPVQQFFGEPVRTYAIEQPKVIYCFDIPLDSGENVTFLSRFRKPICMIMSHGSTANGFETTRDTLKRKGNDAEIWLHEGDANNSWLSIKPDRLLSGRKMELSPDLLLLHTPGHTEGSVCLLVKKSDGFLLTGDTLGGEKSGAIRLFRLKTNDLSPEIFFESLRTLLSCSFRMMLPFHYYPITNAHVRLNAYIEENVGREVRK